MNAGMLSSQSCQRPATPWMKISSRPSPPVSITCSSPPGTRTVRVSDGQSTSIQLESSPSAYVSSAPGRKRPFVATSRASSASSPTAATVSAPVPKPADRPQLPAAPEHRAYLPAIEPERQGTDWGRSERVEALVDKTLYDFAYHYWFRCEVEGIENVPSTGGALLVSNHAGALAPRATRMPKAIKEEHQRPRPVHLTVEHFFKGYPFFSLLVAKIGGVPAHPANVHRLLYDEEGPVLVFPAVGW